MGLRVGIITGEFPPMPGGLGGYTQKLASALATIGHEIHIVTGTGARPTAQRAALREVREPIDLGYAFLHPHIHRWWWSALGRIADIALRYELDVIHVQYQAAAFDMNVPAVNFLPWRMKEVATVVVTFHDLRMPYLFPKAGRLRRWVVHLLARRACGVIVASEADRKSLGEIGIKAKRIRRIPIGSNITATKVSAIKVAEVRQELRLSEGDTLVAFFGLVSQSKGAEQLVKAISELDSSVHLAIIGAASRASSSGEDVAALEQVRRLVAERGLTRRVHWTGALEEDQVSAVLMAADVAVLPYRDGASLRRGTLMAAFAHALPTITTEPSEYVPELVHGENVLLTPIDRPDALRDAIGQVISSPQLKARLATGAAESARQFRWANIANQTSEFYYSLLTSRE